MKRYLPFIIIVAVLAAAIGGFGLLWKQNGGDSTNSTFAPTRANPSPGTSATTAPGESSPQALPTRPNVRVSSPVVLEEYGDYQCPPCGQLYPDLKQIEKEYGNQVQIVFHHFPLARMHKNAVAAARAAEAARNQNRFWEMHDRLYRNQKEWSDVNDPLPIFVGYARQLNLKIEQFTSDMQSNQTDQKISADMQRGTSLGVTGTPTVFLDGNMLKYEATNADGLRRGINILLASKSHS